VRGAISDGRPYRDSCGHFVGSVPNALVLIEFGGEFYWMVGNPDCDLKAVGMIV
jgi:hypothetical protein